MRCVPYPDALTEQSIVQVASGAASINGNGGGGGFSFFLSLNQPYFSLVFVYLAIEPLRKNRVTQRALVLTFPSLCLK